MSILLSQILGKTVVNTMHRVVGGWTNPCDLDDVRGVTTQTVAEEKKEILVDKV